MIGLGPIDRARIAATAASTATPAVVSPTAARSTVAASPFAASGSEALSPDHRPSVAPKGRLVLRRGGRRGPGSFRPAPGPASGARCVATRDRPLWQAEGQMVGSGLKGCGLHSGRGPVQTPVLSCAGPFSGRRGPTTRVAPAECE